MPKKMINAENAEVEYTVTVSRVRSEYAYVVVKTTDSNSAEDIVRDLLDDEKLDDLRFSPGDDPEGDFPWLGTDEDAGSGADVIGELGEVYERLTFSGPNRLRLVDQRITPK